MYPRLIFDLTKLRQNLDAVSKVTHEGGCSMMIVTKGVCADPKVVDLIISHPGVDFLADSRVKNLATYAGKARVAGGVLPQAAVWRSYQCAVAFQHQHTVVLAGKLPGQLRAVLLHLAYRYAAQPGHFAGVRG